MAFRTVLPGGSPAPRRGRGNAVVASAEPLAQRLAQRGGAGGQIGEPWQRESWHFYDVVPELRTACRVTGRAMGQCRLVLARLSSEGEPVPFDFSLDEETGEPSNPEDYHHPGRKMLAAFAGGADGQRELLDAIGVALTVPGEVILVGSLDQVNRDMADDFTRMQAYSTEQVQSSAGRVVVRLDESRRADRPLASASESESDPTAVTAIRVWRPHPKMTYLADSAARSALPVLREIEGYDNHNKANLLSRLAGAGILFIPEDMQLPGTPAKQEPGVEAQVDPFLLYLMEVIKIAIKERDSAAALAPIMVRATREDIEAVKHLTFSTPFDEKVSENRKEAVGRLGVAVDMPGEMLTGYGALQHWTGALVTDDWKGGYLAELMGFASGAITRGWFYPAMVADGHGDLESDVIIWYDDSSVRTIENTGPEAQGAYDRGEISGDAYRRALGYNEGDAPTEEEFILQVVKTLLLKAPSMAPLLLPMVGVTVTDEEAAEGQKMKDLLVPGAATDSAGGPAGPDAMGGATGGSARGSQPVSSSIPADGPPTLVANGMPRIHDKAMEAFLATVGNDGRR